MVADWLRVEVASGLQKLLALRLPGRRHRIGADIGHKRARSLNTMIKPQVTFPVAEGVGIFVGIVAWDLLTDGRVDIAKALLIATPCTIAWFGIRYWKHRDKDKTGSTHPR